MLHCFKIETAETLVGLGDALDALPYKEQLVEQSLREKEYVKVAEPVKAVADRPLGATKPLLIQEPMNHKVSLRRFDGKENRARILKQIVSKLEGQAWYRVAYHECKNDSHGVCGGWQILAVRGEGIFKNKLPELKLERATR